MVKKLSREAKKISDEMDESYNRIIQQHNDEMMGFALIYALGGGGAMLAFIIAWFIYGRPY